MITHIGFIIVIIFSIYLVYGAWFKDFGRKFYNGLQLLPDFYSIFWPKSLKGSVIAFKVLALSMLVLFIVLELLLILDV